MLGKFLGKDQKRMCLTVGMSVCKRVFVSVCVCFCLCLLVIGMQIEIMMLSGCFARSFNKNDTCNLYPIKPNLKGYPREI